MMRHLVSRSNVFYLQEVSGAKAEVIQCEGSFGQDEMGNRWVLV